MRITLLFLIMLAFGCQTRPVSDQKVVAVTILPQKYFVEKIAGDLAAVQVLVPPGASPELYSLMPSQMKDLARSSAWLRIGKIGFEEGWLEKIRQSTPGLKIFDTSVHAGWIAGEEAGHGDHVHLHGVDPHIWSSPKEVRKIVTETRAALISLFPENKDTLEGNYQALMQEIDRLDDELRQQLKPLAGRKFLIFHPALAYFARDYQLEQIALEVDGKEPSPRYMQSLIEQAKKDAIKVIFIQKEFDVENARQLAREIGGEVVQIDPLTEQWAEGLRTIAQKLVNASR